MNFLLEIKFHFNITFDTSPRIAARRVTLYNGLSKLIVMCVLGYDAVWHNRQVTNYSTLKTEELRSTESHLHVYQTTRCHQNICAEPILGVSHKIIVIPQHMVWERRIGEETGRVGSCGVWTLGSRIRCPLQAVTVCWPFSVSSYLHRLSFQRSIRTGQMEFRTLQWSCDSNAVFWNILTHWGRGF
jgi:hypothetical protein